MVENANEAEDSQDDAFQTQVDTPRKSQRIKHQATAASPNKTSIMARQQGAKKIAFDEEEAESNAPYDEDTVKPDAKPVVADDLADDQSVAHSTERESIENSAVEHATEPEVEQPVRPPPTKRRRRNKATRSSQTISTGPDLDYATAKATARIRTASQPKPIQHRTAWSQQETEALIQYIRRYGTSYALIKRQDDLSGESAKLQNRNQVNLKDKARNMKMDYLK